MVLLIIELLGTIAFASSGAMTAIKNKMDVFGVNILGLTTAVGGGLIRDIILDSQPPVMFKEPVYAITALITCNILFTTFYYKRKLLEGTFIYVYDRIMMILDAVGLGIFTVSGIAKGMDSSYDANWFMLIFLGVITGVGGGLIRDIMANKKPYILVKHVYASASIVGSIVMLVSFKFFSNGISMLLGGIITIAIRILAMHFKWDLPKIEYEEYNHRPS